VYFFFHLLDFVEKILGDLCVVTWRLVPAQGDQRILKGFDTLARHL